MLYNRYIYKMLIMATIFVSIILIAVVLLTQSLRFLEVIVESGASVWSFWMLTFLSLPRFFEIIIPFSLATSVIFTFNKMSVDSELAVLKATGYSFWQICKPILLLSLIVTVFLLFATMWLAPSSLSKMQMLRQVVKTQFSTLLFREGVFTDVGDGLTVYIREKASNGELKGLVIQDERNLEEGAITVFAKRGVLAATNEGQEVVVFEGARHEANPENKSLERLNFQRYTIKLPEDRGPARKRWREPDERTFIELLNPDPSNKSDLGNLREFKVEAHKRILGPLLTPVYCLVSALFMLYGTHRRQGHLPAILAAVSSMILLQSLYIATMNAAFDHVWALVAGYALVFVPLIGSLYIIGKKHVGVKS